MSIRETCGKQNDKNRICKNAHIQIAEYVHFIYLAQLNAWTSETFYKKQSKKTVHYQKNQALVKNRTMVLYNHKIFPGDTKKQIKRDRKVNGYQE